MRWGLFKLQGLILVLALLVCSVSLAGLYDIQKPEVLANTEVDLTQFYVLLVMAQEVRFENSLKTLALPLDPADVFEIQELFREQVERMRETYLYLLNKQIATRVQALTDSYQITTYEDAERIFTQAWAQIARETAKLDQARTPLDIGVMIDRIHSLAHGDGFLAEYLFGNEPYWLRIFEIAAVPDGFSFLVSVVDPKIRKWAFKLKRMGLLKGLVAKDKLPSLGIEILKHGFVRIELISLNIMEEYISNFLEIPEIYEKEARDYYYREIAPTINTFHKSKHRLARNLDRQYVRIETKTQHFLRWLKIPSSGGKLKLLLEKIQMKLKIVHIRACPRSS